MNSAIKLGFVIGVLSAGSVFAADGAGTVQRDVDQQTRIEQGLKSGELNTREAAKLEKEEAHVDHMQARDLKDGSLSPAEKAKLAVAQNKVSKDIYAQKHDAQVGNPNSASSMRMQADVQRNVNQQARIEQGVKSGSLSAGETAKLERGQAHVDRKEARAGAAARPGLELQSPCTQGFFCWRSTTLFAMPANPAAARCWWSMAGISCRNEKGRHVDEQSRRRG